MIKIKEDLTGKTYGRLTVIKRAEDGVSKDGKQKFSQWECSCSCGNPQHIIVQTASLNNGNTQSCGCLRKERASSANRKRLKKYNKYDLSGEYGIGWTSNTNKEFYFDLEDYDKIKDYCWSEHYTRDNFSIIWARDCETKKLIKMHVLLGFKNYDHINRNELDNRKDNLREASSQQNVFNSSIAKNNTSGITGVHYDKKRNKWCAQIMINRKGIFLGHYDNKDDAIKSRLIAEQKYFGKFAPQIDLFEKYGVVLNETEDEDGNSN